MTGSEFLVGAAAEGIAALITDTTKTGSSSALGEVIASISKKSKQAIFRASRKYIENYRKRHCQLKVLGMREPVELSAVYTDAKMYSRELLSFELNSPENALYNLCSKQSRFRERKRLRHLGISIANKKQYLMILGGPGTGKSTFLRGLGLESLRTFYYESAEYNHRLIPVLIELKRLEAKRLDIVEFIVAEFETCGFPEAENFARNALEQGNLLILLDGLDEVPSAYLSKVLLTIQDFVDQYNNNRFVSSCRVAAHAYRNRAFQRFSNVTIADFDDTQIQQFVNKWFNNKQDIERGTAQKCWEVLQRPEDRAAKELAHTPLLLTYLCLVYDLSQRFPSNRSSLYRKALRILLEEWAAEKRILRDEIYEGLSIEQEEILLSEIAYEGMISDQLFFDKRQLSAQIKAFLGSNLNAPTHLDSEAVLHAIEVQQGILVERAESAYSFSHLTLQEYLTAQYLVDNAEWKPLIQDHLVDDYWREIFILLPGLMAGKTGANQYLLALEKQSRKYLCDARLQQLMTWATIKTQESCNEISSSVRRISAVFLICLLDLDRALALDLDFSLPLDRSFARDLNSTIDRARSLALLLDFSDSLNQTLTLNLDRERALALNLDLTLSNALDLAYNFSQSKVFKDVDFNELMRKIEQLRLTQKEKGSDRLKREQLLEKLHSFWILALGIEPKVALISQENAYHLANYLHICELIIRCKESAVRVSPDVWKGIESRILTLPVSNESAAD